MDTTLSIIISFCLGIGLSAAAGFRVFLPLFIFSLAAKFGLDLGESWAFLGSWTAIITLGVATFVEILAYYIPWVDNALDSIAIPLAGLAGTLLMGLSLTGIDSEIFQWGLAIIAGGGTAAAIKGTTASGRLMSSTATGGVGNFVVSTTETIASSILGIVSIFLPILAFILVLVVFYYLYKTYKYFKNKKSKIGLRT
ncbi:DUF4126 domain-containing protein [Weeksellaceae bacterium TAE3-ERU29]|nr:DUF4126 domain-containing protein [Weeksellaceae bacterium TAE3-ERU29]